MQTTGASGVGSVSAATPAVLNGLSLSPLVAHVEEGRTIKLPSGHPISTLKTNLSGGRENISPDSIIGGDRDRPHLERSALLARGRRHPRRILIRKHPRQARFPCHKPWLYYVSILLRYFSIESGRNRRSRPIRTTGREPRFTSLCSVMRDTCNFSHTSFALSKSVISASGRHPVSLVDAGVPKGTTYIKISPLPCPFFQFQSLLRR